MCVCVRRFLTGSGLMRKRAGSGEEGAVKPGSGDDVQPAVDSAQEPDTTHGTDLQTARSVLSLS